MFSRTREEIFSVKQNSEEFNPNEGLLLCNSKTPDEEILVIYNSKKEQPSYMILKTDNEIKNEKLKTYKEAQKIAPHILE